MTRAIALGPARVTFAGERLFVLLGRPVAHSLSPRMQRAAFRSAGLDADYVACDVAAGDLAAVLADLRRHAESGLLGGANVTVPHKEAVRPLLDALEPTAALAGAVNTIVPRRAAEGVRLEGWNTDVVGFTAALAEAGVGLAGARLLVLGCGGMARAAVVAGLREGAAELRVASRSPARAREMLDAVTGAWKKPVPRLACTDFESAGVHVADADLVVQATPLGLGAEDPPALSLAAAPAGCFVFDAAYRAGETALVRAARARGLRATGGLAMLACQGAESFALWTGGPAPLEAMRRALDLD
jgi:shikimate dehydrogenase